MQQTSWHAEPVAEVLRQLQAAAGGLSDDDAARRLARYGPNQLTPPRPASALKILLDQLKGVVVALLLAAVGISFLLGDRIEAAAIAGVLLIDMLIGLTTELRSSRQRDFWPGSAACRGVWRRRRHEPGWALAGRDRAPAGSAPR